MVTTLHTPKKIKKDLEKYQIKVQLYQIPQLQGRKKIAKVI